MNQFYRITEFGPRRDKMPEPFDEYIDQLMLAISPYGVALTFKRSSGKPVAPGSVPLSEDVGTIRMSLEHMKVMTFLLKRHLDESQAQMGIDIPLPIRLMNELRIAPEDWQKFWQRS